MILGQPRPDVRARTLDLRHVAKLQVSMLAMPQGTRGLYIVLRCATAALANTLRNTTSVAALLKEAQTQSVMLEVIAGAHRTKATQNLHLGAPNDDRFKYAEAAAVLVVEDTELSRQVLRSLGDLNNTVEDARMGKSPTEHLISIRSMLGTWEAAAITREQKTRERAAYLDVNGIKVGVGGQYFAIAGGFIEDSVWQAVLFTLEQLNNPDSKSKGARRKKSGVSVAWLSSMTSLSSMRQIRILQMIKEANAGTGDVADIARTYKILDYMIGLAKQKIKIVMMNLSGANNLPQCLLPLGMATGDVFATDVAKFFPQALDQTWLESAATASQAMSKQMLAKSRADAYNERQAGDKKGHERVRHKKETVEDDEEIGKIVIPFNFEQELMRRISADMFGLTSTIAKVISYLFE